jgi:CubicO group peptidase (beta-lactamase class C family)
MNAKLVPRRASTWAIALGLWNSGCATNRPPAKALEARVDQLFNAWNRPDSPGATVVVVKDGAVVYQRGYGCANLDYGIPITPQTVFDAASVAKQFTGLAIAMLIDQGKLSLDDDIRTHLPEVPDFGTPITIRHLLHHTSGLRDWFETLVLSGRSPSDAITMDTILEMVRRQRDLDFAPGTEHSYSNTGYNLLAVIVSKVTGQSFRGWTDANLFQPLGMKHTHFCDDASVIVTNRAAYYEAQGEGGLRQFISQLAAPGSSSLMTTAEDMGRWLLHFGSARVGETNAVLMMQQPGKLISGARVDYGFGLGLGNYHGVRNVYHTGSWACDCGMIWFPDKRFGVAVFANGPGVDPGRMTYDIANIYLNVPTLPKTESDRTDGSTLAKPDKPALTFEQLTAYVGDYWSEELQVVYRIEMRNRELTMGYGLSGWGKLLPIRLDRFETKPRPGVPVVTTIEFTRDSTARVNGMKISGGRVRNLQFVRVSLPKSEPR